MAKVDKILQRIFAWAVLLCIVASIASLYLYFDMQQRQAERELIYVKARAMAAQQQRDRAREWRKRRKEQELSQEFNKGRVVDISRRPATQPAAQPKEVSAAQ